MRKKLPKRIYVRLEAFDTGGGYYLSADETTNDASHGETVGIYELKETKTMQVSRALK